MRYSSWLRWWLFVILTGVGLIISFSVGWLSMIYNSDVTKLSVVIGVIYVVMTIWIGMSTYQASKLESGSEKLKKLNREQKVSWFVAAMFLSLGMIGTLVGFIIMLKDGFSNMDVSNAATMQKVMSSIAVGMGTALYTTLVGLIAGIGIRIQAFNLQYHLDSLEPDDRRYDWKKEE